MNHLSLTIGGALALCLTGCSTPSSMNESAATEHFYLGTYSTKLGHVDGKAKGISYWAVDVETGELERRGGPWPIVNTSHLCLSHDNRFLYAISEISEYQGQADGYVTTFAVDPKNGDLTELSTTSSKGIGPAYVRMDQSGKFLLLANYLAGNIVVYPRASNGILLEPSANIMHTGSSVNPNRQEGPHPHSIVASPDNQFVLVADLGLDKIKVYGFDDDAGTLEPLPTNDVTVPAGSGPRHLEFHPSGKFVYLTLEMGSQVAAYHYQDGSLSLVNIYSTLPPGSTTPSSNAELRITRNGQFLYASNRGHDSIAAFQINQATGELDFVHTISTEGKTPRNFAITTNDKIMVAGNQDSHTLLTYHIDPSTGALTRTREKLTSPSPVLFQFESR